ncbi:hypothetical protein DM02DRAFT_632191 [Periconia macrospinosa]|uniref:Uncharacterized protein n=1 Tax=Periconia macrospinosa TaxID=97972 RepID=A0A2V1DDR6_9PLEO|nr:hypothetical protein DM02DRAFT_632191 [Periconia macrospinosa]
MPKSCDHDVTCYDKDNAPPPEKAGEPARENLTPSDTEAQKTKKKKREVPYYFLGRKPSFVVTGLTCYASLYSGVFLRNLPAKIGRKSWYLYFMGRYVGLYSEIHCGR